MIIRSKTFEQWMKANFERDTMRDIANYGASVGFPGLIYYTDTVKLYNNFSNDIWEALNEDADSFGYDTPIEMIASFNGSKNVNNDEQFKNLLVWYMAERIARQLTDDN